MVDKRDCAEFQYDTKERERESKGKIFKIGKGIPIGNLTSQLFANIYMNEFDQFVKRELGVKFYARYTDDFVILAQDKKYIYSLLPQIKNFLMEKLCLELHPDKIIFTKIHRGIDFLGYVVFPHHRLLRTKTKRRMFRKIKERIKRYNLGIIDKYNLNQVLQSYLGVLSHSNSFKLSQDLKNRFWFWINK